MGAAEDLSVVLITASEVFDKRVRAADSFFELGGDSLTAVELVTRLEERLAREIDIVDLLGAGSFGEFSTVINEGLSPR